MRQLAANKIDDPQSASSCFVYWILFTFAAANRTTDAEAELRKKGANDKQKYQNEEIATKMVRKLLFIANIFDFSALFSIAHNCSVVVQIGFWCFFFCSLGKKHAGRAEGRVWKRGQMIYIYFMELNIFDGHAHFFAAVVVVVGVFAVSMILFIIRLCSSKERMIWW